MNFLFKAGCAAAVSAVWVMAPQAVFAIRGDYTGDGQADIVVAESSSVTNKTTFRIRGGSTVILNSRADAYVPGDYNGDGMTDPAIVKVLTDGTLEWRTSILGVESTVIFGLNGDQPIVGDFDGDDLSDRAVIRSENNRLYWYFQLSSQAVQPRLSFGIPGDKVFTADLDADGVDEMIFTRKGTSSVVWASRKISVNTRTNVTFGLPTDELFPPVDLDGDGKADFIVGTVAAGNMTASVKYTNSETVGSIPLGKSSDIVLAGHFSGGEAAELAYYRKGKTARRTSTFTLKLTGGDSAISFGNRRSTVLRPDGSAVTDAATAGMDCSRTVVSLSTMSGILYKPSNLHGARGPTFLVQAAAERTNKPTILVKDTECRVIAKFGLYATDWPYGSRYYQKSGRGSGLSDKQLRRLALKAGHTTILVEGKGKWITVKDPLLREGRVLNGDQVPRF